jgi:hypothetical protein
MDQRFGEIEWCMLPTPTPDRVVEAIIAVCGVDRPDIKNALLIELCFLLQQLNHPPTPAPLKPSK